jgi:site-specific DNA recombinase
LAKGRLAINEIWRKAVSQGLKCGKNQFWVSMRNPVYCGKIFVPKHLEEEAMIVQGQHQPIISEEIFNEVQDVMDGRKPHNRGHIMSPEHLPLRGFLLCPTCGKNLTGSPSKGKYKSYFYYHCISPCRFRVNAVKANKVFENGLANLKPIDGMLELYEECIKHNFELMVKGGSERKRIAKMDLDVLNNKIDKVRELLINDQISPEDYGVIKKQLEEKILSLKKNLNSFDKKQENVNNLIKNLSNTLLDIEKAYFEAEIGLKREIIAAIFPEKLIYHDDGYRTPRLNEGVELIYLINSELNKTKKRGKQ